MAAGYSAELLGLGMFVWLFATGVYTVRRPPVGPYRAPIVVGVVTSQLATLPVIVAGASLGVGIMNAWILLIEILR